MIDAARFVPLLAAIWGLLVWGNWLRWNATGPDADWIAACRGAVELLPLLPPGAALRAWTGHAGSGLLLALLGAAALGAGGAVLTWLRRRETTLRWRIEAAALGAAMGGFLAMGLGFAGLAFPHVAWAGTLLCGVIGVRSAARIRAVRTPPAERGIGWAAAAVVIAVFIPLCGAVAPETSIDAQLHHLAQPAFFASVHRIVALPWNEFGWHPALAHLSFLQAMLIGGPVVAKLVAYGWFLLVVTLVADWARAYVGLRWALWTAAGFALLPYVQLLAMRAYPDAATVAYTAIMMRAVAGPGATPRFAGLWAGLAAATKLTGLLAPATGVVALALCRAPAAAWAWSGCAALAAVLPWAARNWLAAGNPVAPLLPGVFPTLWWDPASVARHLRDLAPAAAEPMALPGAFAVLERGWNACVRNTGVLDPMAGAGPWFLWLLPLLVLPVASAGRTGWMILAALVVWNFMPRLVRYSMPVWPAMSVAAAVALHGLARAGTPGRGIAAAAILGLAFQVPLGVARQHRVVNPVPVACGAEPADRYLARGFPEGARTLAVRDWIAAHRGPERVLMLTPTGLWLTLGPGVVFQTLFDEPLIVRLASSSRSSGEIVKRLRQLRVGYTLYQPFSGFSLQRKYRTWEFSGAGGTRWRECWSARAVPVFAAADRFVIHRLARDGDRPKTSGDGTLPGLDEQWLADAIGGGPEALTEIASARDTGAAWEFLGVARLNAGDEAGALAALTRARVAGRRTVATLASVGVLFARRGRMAEAQAALREALAVDPDRADLRATLDRVHAAAGRR